MHYRYGMKFAVMREAPTFISIMKDANELNSSIFYQKSYSKDYNVEFYVLAPCMFGAIPDIPFSNKYLIKDKQNLWSL